MKTETATFAAGCFWGVEASFRMIPGVLEAVSGYAGGERDHPTYEQVCTGKTGHAESVEVTFDPSVVGYDRLLEAFWSMHDPTTLNRQGPDLGTQYRSAIFTHSDEQFRAATASRDRAQTKFARPIVTQIQAAPQFWPAEAYHQRYFDRHSAACHVTIPQ